MDMEELSELLSNMTNFTNVIEETPEVAAVMLIHEIVYFIICLIGTVADIVIIYIISRYKNMKKPVNLYILNWIISDAINILVEPYFYQIISVVDNISLGNGFVCMFLSGSGILRNVSLGFILVLLLQWFFARTRHDVFEKHSIVVITLVWVVIGLVQLVATSVYCLGYSHYITSHDIIYFVGNLVLLVMLIIVHCMRRCANPFSDTSSLPIALITGFVSCWIPVIIIGMIFGLFLSYNSKIAYYLDAIGLCIGNSYPLVMFYLFYKIDKNFSTCLMRILRRSHDHDDGTTCFEEMEEEPPADPNINNRVGMQSIQKP